MKKLKNNSIIMLFITLFLLWYILKDNLNNSLKLLFSSNLIWIFLSLIIYIIYFILEAIVLKDIINQYQKDYSFKKALRLSLFVKFFNGVTPFATGGQPLQIYELKKEGLKISDGTIVVVEHFIIFQTSIVLLGLISIILNTIFKFVICESFLNWLVIIGFIVNIFLLIIVYLISKSKNFNKKIIGFFIKILSKIKLVKKPKRTIKKIEKICHEYYLGYQELEKNHHLFIKMLITEIISLLIWFTVPIFIFKALGFNEINNILIIIVTSLYIFIVGSYIPIPGGSGGMEYSFVNFFKYYVPMNHLSPALILWRFINYYLPILIGGLAFGFKKRNMK